MQNSNRRSIRLVQISLFLLFQLAFLTAATLHSYARNGQTNTSKFGLGARIDPWGEQVDVALEAAAANRLDWIGVDFDWNKHWPEANSTLDLTSIDHIMQFAKKHEIAVLLSITNAPSWAMSADGPDPAITAGLVAQFIRLYPDALEAIELFPGANTSTGWGAPPDPAAYFQLIKAASAVIHETTGGPQLVTAGLVPVKPSGSRSDIDDLEYLQQLYDVGAMPDMPIISVRFPSMHNEPLAFPRTGGETVLRRYELVRQRMLQNGHKDGLIWVTGFSWPAVHRSLPSDAVVDALNAQKTIESTQSHWLVHALQIMKSQLYMGAAFYDCLNPPDEGGGQPAYPSCLISIDEGRPHIHTALTEIGHMNELAAQQQSLASGSESENSSARFDLIAFWRAISP